MQRLNYYEFLGYLAPGGTLLFGLSVIYPTLTTFLSATNFTIGSLGLFIILSFVAGHIAQAVGNGLEFLWWKAWGGWPSDWPRLGKHRLLSPQQETLIPARLNAMLGGEGKYELKDFDEKGWKSIVSQIGAALKAANRAERLEDFNGNYGLSRGLFSVFSILLAFFFYEFGWSQWKGELALVVLMLLMLSRMHRFGWRYARELFIAFLALSSAERTASRGD